jgi:hypothetical protein
MGWEIDICLKYRTICRGTLRVIAKNLRWLYFMEIECFTKILHLLKNKKDLTRMIKIIKELLNKH